MPTSDQEALVRQVFHEGTTEPNPRSILDAIFAPGFACHGPPGMEHSHDGGAEGLEVCIFNHAFADLGFTVGEVKTADDRVTVHFTATGKQVAEFMGVPPAGRSVSVSGTAIFRVENDLIAEAWGPWSGVRGQGPSAQSSRCVEITSHSRSGSGRPQPSREERLLPVLDELRLPPPVAPSTAPAARRDPVLGRVEQPVMHAPHDAEPRRRWE